MRELILRLWNSPTFTTWANLSTKSLRFLLVTPLILTTFDTTEIAAWYLFGSLTFFGSIIHTRVTLTFNRMIAFAMAGAQDLSSILNSKKARGDGEPHWPTVKRAYGAVGFLTLVTATLAAISGWGLGYFSLGSMLEGYADPNKIWIALLVMVGGQTFSMGFSQYGVTIQGMGLVALSNRWSCLFSLMSIAAGFTALTLGAGIITLAVVMQGAMLLDVVRMKMLVNYVHEGELRSSRSIAFDKEVISWAWPAFWRGLFTTMINRGVIQLGAVVYARYAAVEAVAAYLFSFNMLRTVASFAEAPAQSSGPLLSRTMAKGDLKTLKRLFFKTTTQAQLLFVAGTTAIGVLIPIGLGYINSNTRFLEPLPWIALSTAHIVQRYILAGLRLPALGNSVIYVKETTIAAAITFSCLIPFVKYFEFYGLIAAMYLPFFIMLNFGPFIVSARIFNMSALKFITKSCAWAIPAYIAIQAILIAFIY